MYTAERAELLALGRGLSESDAATMTIACPAWSIKDVYAHLAGISSDILAGNTEGAATEAWADGHVRDRSAASLTQVLDEWQTSGAGVSDVMEVAGDAFPFQLFMDQWTHGWDIRAAIGDPAAAQPSLDVWEHFFIEIQVAVQRDIPADLETLTVEFGDRTLQVGAGPAIGSLALDLFEFARISMGRRSQSQLDALRWPDSVTDTAPYVAQLVFWSVNDHDVVDPVPG